MYFYPTCVNIEKKVVKISTNFRLHTLYLYICLKTKNWQSYCKLVLGLFFSNFFFSFQNKKMTILYDLNKGNDDFMLNNKSIKFCYFYK